MTTFESRTFGNKPTHEPDFCYYLDKYFDRKLPPLKEQVPKNETATEVKFTNNLHMYAKALRRGSDKILQRIADIIAEIGNRTCDEVKEVENELTRLQKSLQTTFLLVDVLHIKIVHTHPTTLFKVLGFSNQQPT